MRQVTLMELFSHPITQKYVRRSGMAHAIAVAYHAFSLACSKQVDPDAAAKAGFLHDIGHYAWYDNGKWDYKAYKKHDIHPIKGAERAHKLLIRLGEHPSAAKDISLAILFHTDSILPKGALQYTALQEIIHLADEMDKQPGNQHHYKVIDKRKEVELIRTLDQKIEAHLESHRSFSAVSKILPVR